MPPDRPSWPLLLQMLDLPLDSNLTLTLLTNSVLELQKAQAIPSTLYLQMDNTARENKNKYVLGFCAALVELRIFKKVGALFKWVCTSHRSTSFLLGTLTRILIGFSKRSEMKSVVPVLSQYQVRYRIWLWLFDTMLLYRFASTYTPQQHTQPYRSGL